MLPMVGMVFKTRVLSFVFFFSSRRRHTRFDCDWSSDVCSSDLASKPLRFGTELSAMSLREIAWPQDAVPAGAFSKIAELTASRRVVLTAIEANEDRKSVV